MSFKKIMDKQFFGWKIDRTQKQQWQLSK